MRGRLRKDPPEIPEQGQVGRLGAGEREGEGTPAVAGRDATGHLDFRGREAWVLTPVPTVHL